MAFNYFLPYRDNEFFSVGLDKLSMIFNKLINREASIIKMELEKESELEGSYLKDNEWMNVNKIDTKKFSMIQNRKIKNTK